jgi:hypothetical protein
MRHYHCPLSSSKTLARLKKHATLLSTPHASTLSSAGITMADDRNKLDKVIALAIHPTTVPAEAVAAFNRARQLVKQNPDLAHPPPEPEPAAPAQPAVNAKFTATITNLHPDWILIFVALVSKTGHEAGLKYRIDFDFSQAAVAIKLQCEGDERQCNLFEWNATWCVNYINEQLKKKT